MISAHHRQPPPPPTETSQQYRQPPPPKEKGWASGCLPWVVGAVVVFIVLGVIASLGEDPDEDDSGEEPGIFNIARAELEMSWYCDEVDGWEYIALWILGNPDDLVDDPSDNREVATAIVTLGYMCDYWRAKGNREIAALLEEDPEAVARLDAYLEGIGIAKIFAEIDRVEADLPTLRSNRDRMRLLDKALGE